MRTPIKRVFEKKTPCGFFDDRMCIKMLQSFTTIIIMHEGVNVHIFPFVVFFYTRQVSCWDQIVDC